MRVPSPVAIAAVVLLFGCSSRVEEPGVGGAPAGGAPSGETTASPGCPREVPVESSACSEEGKVCTYTTGDCVIVFECKPHRDDPDDSQDDCVASPAAWLKTDQSECGGCSGAGASCVRCDGAGIGEPCDAVGYACATELAGGNCGSELRCRGDRTWGATGRPWCCI
ncbi:uncharacterized protein SOCE26_061070 [Sorangium cellulosum]|uniref:Uncharacterized protein n=1 Tax=Sorangium cellulosum TaxID=56 RepID=A0A2L0EZA7_SORCE|nr:uncharacterized protein SOCE26_061070 [Sorangium cellulosum]